MFDSLTKREKVLAIATAASLVVTLIFIAFFWLMSSYSANETTLRGILGQIEREDAKTRKAMAATRRKAWYAATSLSSNSDNAKNEYIAWLMKTLRDDIGVDLKGVDPERTTSISHEGVKVADQITPSHQFVQIDAPDGNRSPQESPYGTLEDELSNSNLMPHGSR